MSHRRRPQPLDKTIAHAIKELHGEYPFLGHDGIARLLEDEGIEVDSHELRVFMEENHIKAQPQATWVHSKDPRQALRFLMGMPPWP